MVAYRNYRQKADDIEAARTKEQKQAMIEESKIIGGPDDVRCKSWLTNLLLPPKVTSTTAKESAPAYNMRPDYLRRLSYSIQQNKQELARKQKIKERGGDIQTMILKSPDDARVHLKANSAKHAQKLSVI